MGGWPTKYIGQPKVGTNIRMVPGHKPNVLLGSVRRREGTRREAMAMDVAEADQPTHAPYKPLLVDQSKKV